MNTKALRFTKDHVWVRLGEGDEVEMGLTDYAQETLGEISFVDLPKLGKRVRAHESVAVVESVKAASEVLAPIGGIVAEVNAGLDDEPERINQDPYGRGWICHLSDCDMQGLKTLMTADAYRDFVATR
jgi:glycine cleavage system H protein